MSEQKPVTKILWIDLEMTGLNVETDVIIEVAAVATDLKWQPLGRYHAVVNQPQVFLDRMDDWNKKHHGESGLLAQIPSGLPPPQVEQELVQFVKDHFGSEKAILGGNSIGQDRLFLTRYFPNIIPLLHYRNLDVSSWKIIFKEIYGLTYKKKQAHRAVDDIFESIEELKFYMSHIKSS